MGFGISLRLLECLYIPDLYFVNEPGRCTQLKAYPVLGYIFPLAEVTRLSRSTEGLVAEYVLRPDEISQGCL